MASGKQVHSRSISLPARLLHPNSLKIEEELSRFKSSKESSSSASTAISSSNAESIQMNLVRIAELYNTIQQLMQSPCMQQALRSQQHKTLVEEALESSVELLDVCQNAREMIMNMKVQVQDLQSALRRRGGDHSSLEENIQAYINFRKKSRKDGAKNLRALRKTENRIQSFDTVDHVTLAVIKLLRESSVITVSIFCSILLLLSLPEMKTKDGGWSLIRKLIPAASSSKQIFNEVGSVDLAVYSLQGQIREGDAKNDVQVANRRLEALNLGMKNVEKGLDCLFRRLIQNRASLLNILTP